jgi:hypothetical protein
VVLLQCSAARLLRLSLMGACAQLSCAGSACPSMMQTAAPPPRAGAPGHQLGAALSTVQLNCSKAEGEERRAGSTIGLVQS